MSDLTRPDDWDQPVVVPTLTAVHRILVPFDGSHAAERALAWADLMARTVDAEIIVAVSYEPPLTKKGRGSTYVDTIRSELQDESHELAEEATAALLGRGRRARAIVVRGEPSASVLQLAEDEDVDVIVLGRRGLTSELSGLPGAVEKLRSSLSGGVAERVVRLAETAVLVVD
jgi:nucleotide-binding universal stress UspA family protein